MTVIADNLDNPEQQDNAQAQPEAPAPEQQAESQATWKEHLRSDLRNSPLSQKFDNDIDGLNKFAESYANLEKLLGHEKVPIPKGPDDVEGWTRYSKALGIPDKASGYSLPDPALPETLKNAAINKERFAEVVHAHKLTPSQAEGLWKSYNEINMDLYNRHVEGQKKNIADMVTRLKGEWGDTYDTNVELGQMVINKFSSDQEMNDYITAVLSQDPRGVKFLAKIGDQFAENKVGEFQMKRFSLAPDEAQSEIDKATADLDGPYMNHSGKFSEREHQAAMDRINHLRALIIKSRGQA